MFLSDDDKDFADKQKEILKLLLEKPYQQKDLAKALEISGAGLLYHIEILEKRKIIVRKTLAEVGNVSLKEVSLHPGAVQRARAILGQKSRSYTLVTAFGKDSDLGQASTIPSKVAGLLKEQGFDIARVVVFVTPASNLDEARALVPIDQVHTFEYNDFRNDDSKVMKELSTFIEAEQKSADVIIDVTGLTKLLTIKLLEISHNFRIPSVYLGIRSDGTEFLLWLRK